jgi:hypothetical protein
MIASNASSNGTMAIGLSGTGAAASATNLSSLSCTSSALIGSAADTCTVTLNAATGSGGLTVSLASSNSAVTVPSTVTVPAGATSAGFTATVSSVSSAQTVTLTATASGMSKTFNLELGAAVPTLSVSATSVTFGSVLVNTPAAPQPVTLTSTGTVPVTISGAALTGTGFTVSGITFPVTLNPGQAATLNVEFDPASAGTATGQLTLTSNSSTGSTTAINLSGTGVPVLTALNCSSGSMTGAGTDACTVTLNAAAPSGGFTVSLLSGNPAVTVPATLTVPTGATSAGFTATVSSISSAQTVTLTATATGATQAFALQLNAALPSLSLSTNTLAFGNVTVNTAATPQAVTLTSTGSVPVTISGATLTGTGFTVSGFTFPVTLNPGQAATLNVEFDPTSVGSETAQLIIASNSSTGSSAVISLSGSGTAAPAALSALSCSSGAMTGAGTDACTVTLTASAPSGGLIVNLSSSSSAVTVPSTVTVPAGAASAGFTASVSSVTTAQAATMTASAGGVLSSFTLQLNAAILALSINATSVAFGDVLVNTPATQSVTMTSTGTVPVTINGATLTGAGFAVSGAEFPATLNPGQAATLNIEFDPTTVGAATGQLTITSNSSTNGTAVIALTGTGTAAPVVAVAVTPANASITTGTTQQFSASVTGTSNTAVTWAASGAGCSGTTCGTISSTGLYTAPATVPAPATVTITATSASDPTKSASAAVTILPPPGATYYLAPASAGGNDSNNGQSPNAPWLTPNHAVNCGDVIIAAAGTYAASNFQYSWHSVTCPAGNNVAWVICATFDTCKIPVTSNEGIGISQSYWGIQGFEVDGSSSSAGCFVAWPVNGHSIDHIIFANDIAVGCGGGGFVSANYGTYGVDYLAIVGNIAYGTAGGSTDCASGISIWQPLKSDSAPGTHLYVAGNLSYSNMNPVTCNGGAPTDGNGLIFDTFDGSQTLGITYDQQAVAENNLLIGNGGRGIDVYENNYGSGPWSHIYIVYNTTWDNELDPNLATDSGNCGEIELFTVNNIEAYHNLAVGAAAHGCHSGSYTIYAYTMNTGNATDHVYDAAGYAASGTTTLITSSTGFSFGPNNLFGTDPGYAAPAVPGAPSCSSYASAAACIAPILANFKPSAAYQNYGVQPVQSENVYDPLYPQWLCNVNVPTGLVTPGCLAEP